MTTNRRPSRSGITPFLAAIVAALLPLASDALGFGVGKVYRDPAHKFSLKTLNEWEQVPVEAGDAIEIAKWHDPVERGFMWKAEMKVIRVITDKQKTEPLTGSGSDGKIDKSEVKKLMASMYGSAFEALTSNLFLGEGQKAPDKDKDGKPITSLDKVPGKIYAWEMDLSSRYQGGYYTKKDLTYFAVAATFERDGVDYGIMCSGPMRLQNKLEGDFKSVCKSFRFFDENAKDVVSLDVLDGVNITAGRRAEIENSLIKGWGIMVSPKKNYIVIYNMARGKNKALARTIAERIEKIREKVYEVQFPPAQKVDAVSIVRVCKDAKEYHAYGGPGGSAGYWNSWSEELVFYDMVPSKKVDENTLAVLYHEAFHQYIFYSVGNVAPHSWFNEGHGDYYAGSKYTAGNFKIAPFKWRTGTVKDAIRKGPRERIITKDAQGKESVTWGNTGYTPLEHLVRFTQPDYYAYPGISYAQGWSFVYFLREVVPKNKEYKAKWGHILDVYFNTLKDEVNKTGQMKRAGQGDPEKPAGPGDDPKPGEPGKDGEPGEDGEPGDEGDPDDGDTDEPAEEVDPGFQPEPVGFATPDALRLAIDAAFKGVNFQELEKAWKEATLKVSG